MPPVTPPNTLLPYTPPDMYEEFCLPSLPIGLKLEKGDIPVELITSLQIPDAAEAVKKRKLNSGQSMTIRIPRLYKYNMPLTMIVCIICLLGNVTTATANPSDTFINFSLTLFIEYTLSIFFI